MKCYVLKSEKKTQKNGEDYFNRTFYLQGVGLAGMVPIRVCYFGKPVMEKVMEKVIDLITNKPKLDKDGKEMFVEKKDKDGNVIMQAKKDENGKEILRDDDYYVREDLLDMFAADYKSGEACNPVEVYSQAKKTDGEDGEKYNYFIKVGKESIPIEVIDFSTAERTDYKYRGNLAKMRYLANN